MGFRFYEAEEVTGNGLDTHGQCFARIGPHMGETPRALPRHSLASSRAAGRAGPASRLAVFAETERHSDPRVAQPMSKQALIDRIWRDRLSTYQAHVPPPAKVPALLPEPGPFRVIAIPLATIAGTALAAFLGFGAGITIRSIFSNLTPAHDDIDWESGLT